LFLLHADDYSFSDSVMGDMAAALSRVLSVVGSGGYGR
jgi:hypothetical protein